MSHFLQVYHAQAGQEVIREGDTGDFMMFIIEGRIQVFKQGVNHTACPIAVVGAGKMLGEMSLFMGDPRSATCIADAPTVMGVLTRASLANIIIEQPIRAKIRLTLVVMLSHRLRETSSQLLACLDRERGQQGSDAAGGFL